MKKSKLPTARQRNGNSTDPLFLRLWQQVRPYWFALAILFLLGLLSASLALLTPLPLKIVVDSVLAPHPLPRFLEALLPAAIPRSQGALLALAAGLVVVGQPPGDGWALRARLLRRLRRLHDELPRRARAQAAFGGPETLLHGDLWAINVFVVPAGNGLRAQLVDWDHAAVGPYTYDLSTFLLRFPAEHRRWVLELYRQAVAPADWRLPAVQVLNSLFETHEYARIVNRLIWPAIAQVADHAPWGAEALMEVGQWFEALAPVLPRVAQNRPAQLVPA